MSEFKKNNVGLITLEWSTIPFNQIVQTLDKIATC